MVIGECPELIPGSSWHLAVTQIAHQHQSTPGQVYFLLTKLNFPSGQQHLFHNRKCGIDIVLCRLVMNPLTRAVLHLSTVMTLNIDIPYPISVISHTKFKTNTQSCSDEFHFVISAIFMVVQRHMVEWLLCRKSQVQIPVEPATDWKTKTLCQPNKYWTGTILKSGLDKGWERKGMCSAFHIMLCSSYGGPWTPFCLYGH